MTYVVSNLHGEYGKFCDLLKEIKFSDSDILYILGDLVDYGDESMELIADLSVRTNVYSIAGEHDFLAARMLAEVDRTLSGGSMPDPDRIAEMTAWVQDGGEKTLAGFRALDEDRTVAVGDLAALGRDMPDDHSDIREQFHIRGKRLGEEIFGL